MSLLYTIQNNVMSGLKPSKTVVKIVKSISSKVKIQNLYIEIIENYIIQIMAPVV